ncbi:hypothetical protein D3C77_415600 [compost metagenome]
MGLNGFQSVKSSLGLLMPAVNSRAAASPNTRPAARIVPVKIMGKAIGSIIDLIVFHFDRPRARLASFCATGTLFIPCSVIRTISGKLNTVRASAPENRENPKPKKCTITSKPNNPTTMEGNDDSTSTIRRIKSVTFPGLAYSLI